MLTTLHGFDSLDVCAPYAGLIQDTDGNFYGTKGRGGSGNSCSFNGCGTVFALSVGLGPFVETAPTKGRVGSSVSILGTKLRGATSVTFKGTVATFTVELPTAIRATVPTGATTGPVQVMTPSGTLTSNVNFRVAP